MSQPDENYASVLVYQDHLMKFRILRHLQTKRAEEVTMHLLGIFLFFGGACVLLSDNGREFWNKRIENLKIT